jgi:hypothetical protein
MWVYLDISPPKLGCLYVYGKLSFDPKAVNITLQVKCLIVYGSVEIVGEHNGTYHGSANIILYGAKGKIVSELLEGS